MHGTPLVRVKQFFYIFFASHLTIVQPWLQSDCLHHYVYLFFDSKSLLTIFGVIVKREKLFLHFNELVILFYLGFYKIEGPKVFLTKLCYLTFFVQVLVRRYFLNILDRISRLNCIVHSIIVFENGKSARSCVIRLHFSLRGGSNRWSGGRFKLTLLLVGSWNLFFHAKFVMFVLLRLLIAIRLLQLWCHLSRDKVMRALRLVWRRLCAGFLVEADYSFFTIKLFCIRLKIFEIVVHQIALRIKNGFKLSTISNLAASIRCWSRVS